SECVPEPSVPIFCIMDCRGYKARPLLLNKVKYQRIAQELIFPALYSLTCFQKFSVWSMLNLLIFSLSKSAISSSIFGLYFFQARSHVAHPQLLATRKKNVSGSFAASLTGYIYPLISMTFSSFS